MKAKRKILVSILAIVFVLLAVIATIAIVFAATQQNIKTSLKIDYTVEDIDGTASATFTVGGITESLVAMKGDTVLGDKLVFKATDTEYAGNLMFPEDGLALTRDNDNVVIQYTYSNTGDKHYIASMSFDALLEYENMKVEYSIDGTTYSEQRYAVVVPANTSNRSYWIKISIADKAKNANFSGEFNWLLSGCDPQTEEYKSLEKVEIVEGSTEGTYSAMYNGEEPVNGIINFPSEINGTSVTEITSNSSLTQAQKNQIISVNISDSVETIGNSAFQDYQNLQTVTFEQNETTSSASVQSVKGLTSIGNSAFYGCGSLKEIIIPNTVTNMGDYVFQNCRYNLEKVVFAENSQLIIMPISAFHNCMKLKSITMPSNLTTLKDRAFFACESLEELVIPSTLASMGIRVFNNCKSLAKIEVEQGNSVYHSAGNCLIQTASKTLVKGCKSSVIPTDGSVTSILEYAFQNCTGLTEITIPDSITSIGSEAFLGCTGLTSLVIGNGVTNINSSCYSGLENLTSLVIGSSVKSIDVSWLNNLKNLTSIEVVEGNTVYHSAGNCLIETKSKILLRGCSTSIIPIDGTVTSIDERAFYNCTGLTSMTIPNSVTSIGKEAFYGCKGLTEIVIPDSVTSIGSYVFEYCTVLKSVTIGSGVTSISSWSFYGCTGLTEIVIPDSVTSIGGRAFENCTVLKSVTIGRGLYNIGYAPFSGCGGLTSIEVAEGNTTYHSAGNCLIETASKTLIQGCNTTVIPTDGSVTSIGSDAFRGCSSLTEIVIPDSVTSIGNYAFSGCTGLTSVTIGNGVTSIGKSAFYNCTGLTSVTFKNTAGWFIASSSSATSGTSVDVTSANTNLISWLTINWGYYNKYWKRS